MMMHGLTNPKVGTLLTEHAESQQSLRHLDSHLTVNTLGIVYKDQPVNAVQQLLVVNRTEYVHAYII
jgi:hypothetical protein